MKAVLMRKYGDNAVVEVADVPRPTLGAGEVLVEVHAASVNPIDFKTRNGDVRMILRYELPLVMGNDLSGVVVERGPGVTEVATGDAVYARLGKRRIGAFAEYAAVRVADLAPKPVSLDHVQAASLPLVGLTSLQALRERAHLAAGQKVLIHAGSGGVGTFAIQLAKHMGATVATTCSAKNADLVRSLGADVVVDYKSQRFDEVLSGYDVVLDGLGGDTLDRSFAVLAPGGCLVSISGTPDPKFARDWQLNALLRVGIWAMSRKVMRLARRHQVRYEFLFMDPSGAQLREIGALVDSGVIKPVVDREFALDDAREALAYSESGHARGKVVLKIR